MEFRAGIKKQHGDEESYSRGDEVWRILRDR